MNELVKQQKYKHWLKNILCIRLWCDSMFNGIWKLINGPLNYHLFIYLQTHVMRGEDDGLSLLCSVEAQRTSAQLQQRERRKEVQAFDIGEMGKKRMGRGNGEGEWGLPKHRQIGCFFLALTTRSWAEKELKVPQPAANFKFWAEETHLVDWRWSLFEQKVQIPWQSAKLLLFSSFLVVIFLIIWSQICAWSIWESIFTSTGTVCLKII